MRAAFLDWASIDAGDMQTDCLESLPLEWTYYDKIDPNEHIEQLQDYAILVTNKVVLDAACLAQLPQLKLICICATGTNNVDLVAARERGIIVCNVRGYATDSVVQHVFMLILNLYRQFTAYQQALTQGRWQASEHFCFLDYRIESVTGKTLGIIGYGELGRAVANMAQHMGMQVLVAQSHTNISAADRVSLDELLTRSDVVSLHCPLTEQTRYMIGEQQLARMKPSAILINTARGGLVDEAALLAALQAKQIAGAGIDVLETEPPTQEAMLLNSALPNLIVTPHIAWAARQARQASLTLVAKNIQDWQAGSLSTQVN